MEDGTTVALADAFKDTDEKESPLTVPQQIIKVCGVTDDWPL